MSQECDSGALEPGRSAGRPVGVEAVPGLVRPLNARSVLASTLLGSHPPELPVAVLVRTAAAFGISEGTTRVALSRMATRGEVENRDGRYLLTGTLAARQRGLDVSRSPHLREWDGSWTVLVLGDAGRLPAARRSLRRGLRAARLGELREGVWLRPDNLLDTGDAPLIAELAEGSEGSEPGGIVASRFTARPAGDPRDLARTVFDLDGWAASAHALLLALDAASATGSHLATVFSLDAAMLRHLRADPLLPGPLEPPGWPAEALRSRFQVFDAAFRRRWRAWVA